MVRLGNAGARNNIPDDDNNPNNADVDFFEIDPETGNVTVKKMLSYEADDGRGLQYCESTAGEYKFIVRATDPSGESDEDPPDSSGVYAGTGTTSR